MHSRLITEIPHFHSLYTICSHQQQICRKKTIVDKSQLSSLFIVCKRSKSMRCRIFVSFYFDFLFTFPWTKGTILFIFPHLSTVNLFNRLRRMLLYGTWSLATDISIILYIYWLYRPIKYENNNFFVCVEISLEIFQKYTTHTATQAHTTCLKALDEW